jgi:hypothetical protein
MKEILNCVKGMKMKLEVADGTGIIEGNADDGSSIEYSIGNEAMLMDMLRNRVYSNKVQTLTQEYASNGRDACREVNREHIPLKITLPTKISPILKIRDYGIGMTPDRIRNVFTRYGISTKRNDNKQTGGYGLGAKLGFCYTDNFSVVTYVDGIAYSCNCNVAKSAKGHLENLGQAPTNEPNGTEIQIAILNPETDISQFIKAVFRATLFWDVQPDLLGITDGEIPLFFKKGVKEPIYACDNWKIYPQSELNNIVNGGSHGSSSLILIIDGIPYLPPIDLVNQMEPLKELKEFTNSSHSLTISIDTGEIDIAIDRERVEVSPKTRTNLEQIAIKALASLKSFFEKYKSQTESFDLFLYNNIKAVATLKTSENKAFRANDSIILLSPDLCRITVPHLFDNFLIEKHYYKKARTRTLGKHSTMNKESAFQLDHLFISKNQKINSVFFLKDIEENPNKELSRIRAFLDKGESDLLYLLTPKAINIQPQEKMDLLLKILKCENFSSIIVPPRAKKTRVVEKLAESVVYLNFYSTVNSAKLDENKLDLDSLDVNVKKYVYFETKHGLETGRNNKTDEMLTIFSDVNHYLRSNNYMLCGCSTQRSLLKIKGHPRFITFDDFKKEINKNIPLTKEFKNKISVHLWKGLGKLFNLRKQLNLLLDPTFLEIMEFNKKMLDIDAANKKAINDSSAFSQNIQSKIISLLAAKFLYGAIDVNENLEVSVVLDKLKKIEESYPILDVTKHASDYLSNEKEVKINMQIIEYLNFKYKEELTKTVKE